jgi:hypothetical protein
LLVIGIDYKVCHSNFVFITGSLQEQAQEIRL